MDMLLRSARTPVGLGIALAITGCDPDVSKNYFGSGRADGSLSESTEHGRLVPDAVKKITASVTLEVDGDGIPTAAQSSYLTDAGTCSGTWEFSRASQTEADFIEGMVEVAGDEAGCADSSGSITALDGGFTLTRSVGFEDTAAVPYDLVWSGELYFVE